MSENIISIIIPVYNGSNYLRDAIDSTLAQTYKNCEVIVVNDGSTDNGETDSICKSYGNRIRYFSKKNGGVSSVLNLGIREMHGEYFTWLAHDDMYYPQKLELQIKALEQSTDKTAIIHGNYDLLNVKHNKISRMRQEDSYSALQLTNSVFALLMATLHASTPLIHKSHFERVGVFDENLPLTQDYDFLFRAMRSQKSIFLTESLLLSRLHDQSGKNTDNRFGLASAEQYKHFADSLAYSEVRDMFVSPRAFYLRIVAMMKARYDTPDADKLLAKISELPMEAENLALAKYIIDCSANEHHKLCIFGAGYHGKVLKYELEHRRIDVACFCDNDEQKHGTSIMGTPCLSLSELMLEKSDTLVIIAADVSDAIETQLKDLGFLYIATKKKLDSAILETPPLIR
ncbi:MAG: glycosyltransferase [Fibromonadaceae bacterium]|jgi:glycosyltransferase involved in cell wall biosynthesis|nr:glycosyltransferase [Fibromonadaceae bacterium]